MLVTHKTTHGIRVDLFLKQKSYTSKVLINIMFDKEGKNLKTILDDIIQTKPFVIH